MTLDEFKKDFQQVEAQRTMTKRAAAATPAPQFQGMGPAAARLLAEAEDAEEEEDEEEDEGDLYQDLSVAYALLRQSMEYLGFYGDPELSNLELNRGDSRLMLELAAEIQSFLNEANPVPE